MPPGPLEQAGMHGRDRTAGTRRAHGRRTCSRPAPRGGGHVVGSGDEMPDMTGPMEVQRTRQQLLARCRSLHQDQHDPGARCASGRNQPADPPDSAAISADSGRPVATVVVSKCRVRVERRSERWPERIRRREETGFTQIVAGSKPHRYRAWSGLVPRRGAHRHDHERWDRVRWAARSTSKPSGGGMLRSAITRSKRVPAMQPHESRRFRPDSRSPHGHVRARPRGSRSAS